MKSIALLPAAVAVMLGLSVPTALSQDNCSNAYVGCVEACISKQPKLNQGPCIQTCQVDNNQCAEQVYGRKSYSTSTAAQQIGAAKDALAKTQPEPQEPAADDKPPQPRRGAKPSRN